MTTVLEHRSPPVVDEQDTTSATPAPTRRRDIQGLRAIAVALVVLYHAGVPGITGGYVGVDVFFVISGFLITGQILRDIDRDGRLSLGSFYARRMRRLFPAALFVVVVTMVVARLWGPVLQIKSTATDALWTAGYAINFRLAAEGVNYQQAAGPQSPLQHFWSLAVEEQFYLVWPLVIIVTLVLARRLRRGVVAAVLVACLAGSLYLSVTVTVASAPTAYFSVQTRAWEFAFGALVALLGTHLGRIHGVVRSVATWVGLALIVGSALRYDDSTAFPGVAALAPVLGCALVILGGCGPLGRYSTSAVLDRRPMQAVGTVSYSWYLWHWPVLILAPAVLGQTFSWGRNVELCLLALWFAALTYAIVERPTQRGKSSTRSWLPRGLVMSGSAAAVALGVVVLAPDVIGTGGIAQPLDLSSPSTTAISAALLNSAADTRVPSNLTPSLTRAAADVPMSEGGCHLQFLEVQEGSCVFGDPGGTKTVVLFGDSHAQQWGGALDAEAKRLHWKLVSWTKAACPVASVTLVNPTLNRPYVECDQWRAAMVSQIAALHPSLVVASQSDAVPGGSLSNADWAADTLKTLKQLESPGTHVVFISDTPYPKGNAPDCIASNLDNVSLCSTPRSQAYHDKSFTSIPLYTSRHELISSVLRGAGVSVVDPLNWFCTPSVCPVIVGNIQVYRDTGHITNSYSTALGPILQPLFEPMSTTLSG